jgi:hypothetical protein
VAAHHIATTRVHGIGDSLAVMHRSRLVGILIATPAARVDAEVDLVTERGGVIVRVGVRGQPVVAVECLPYNITERVGDGGPVARAVVREPGRGGSEKSTVSVFDGVE